jgi:hypothetical protein
MAVYQLKRHVIELSGSQSGSNSGGSQSGSKEVWGIDRPAHGLPSKCFDCRDNLLLMRDGEFVTWCRIFEWFSEAAEAGYEVISGFEKLSPYSTIIIRQLPSSS